MYLSDPGAILTGSASSPWRTGFGQPNSVLVMETSVGRSVTSPGVSLLKVAPDGKKFAIYGMVLKSGIWKYVDATQGYKYTHTR